MTILRGNKDPRTAQQRQADERLVDRVERGVALVVTPEALEAGATRIRERNAERRREVARLGTEIAELRRVFGMTQDEIARAIGTSTPNISALERGRAPGISLERFMAVIDTLRARVGEPANAGVPSEGAAFSPTAGMGSLDEALETA